MAQKYLLSAAAAVVMYYGHNWLVDSGNWSWFELGPIVGETAAVGAGVAAIAFVGTTLALSTVIANKKRNTSVIEEANPFADYE